MQWESNQIYLKMLLGVVINLRNNFFEIYDNILFSHSNLLINPCRNGLIHVLDPNQTNCIILQENPDC